MAKEMSPVELEQHIKECVEQLSRLLDDWRTSKPDKAQKVAYWVREYSAFLRREDGFSCSVVPRLKRGMVLSVDFGFRLGREFGGRHFAVVLDNENAVSSPIVTVVPLFSLKEGYTPNKYTCVLEDGIYAPMLQRTQSIIDEANKLLPEYPSTEEQGSTPEGRAISAALRGMVTRAQRMVREIEHLKEGSVANTCQITTISKMRIKRPLTKDDPLYGLRLSANDMDKINSQLKELYIFNK